MDNRSKTRVRIYKYVPEKGFMRTLKRVKGPIRNFGRALPVGLRRLPVPHPAFMVVRTALTLYDLAQELMPDRPAAIPGETIIIPDSPASANEPSNWAFPDDWSHVGYSLPGLPIYIPGNDDWQVWSTADPVWRYYTANYTPSPINATGAPFPWPVVQASLGQWPVIDHEDLYGWGQTEQFADVVTRDDVWRIERVHGAENVHEVPIPDGMIDYAYKSGHWTRPKDGALVGQPEYIGPGTQISTPGSIILPPWRANNPNLERATQTDKTVREKVLPAPSLNRIVEVVVDEAPDTVPQPQKVPTRRHPAPVNEKENKVIPRSRRLGLLLVKALDNVSENAEIISAVYDALPKDVRKRWERGRDDDYKHRRMLDTLGQYGLDGADWKAQAIWHNWHRIDYGQAVENIVRNEIEDKILGNIHKRTPRNTGGALDDSFIELADLMSSF